MSTNDLQALLTALADTADGLSRSASTPELFADASRILGHVLPIRDAVLVVGDGDSSQLSLYRSGSDPPSLLSEEAARPFREVIVEQRPRSGLVGWPDSPPGQDGWLLPLRRSDSTVAVVGIVPSDTVQPGTTTHQTLLVWSSLLAYELSLRHGLEVEREHQALYHFIQPLVAELDLRQAFPRAMAEVEELTGLDQAALLIIDEDRQCLRFFAGTSLPWDDSWAQIPLAGTASGRALAEGIGIHVGDTQEGSFALDRALLAKGIRSHVAYPLLESGRLVGSLNLGSGRPHAFDDLSQPVMTFLCTVLALAVGNTLLFERVRTSGDRYSSLVDDTHELLYRLDRQGRLLVANQAARRLLGRDAVYPLGRPLLELVDGAGEVQSSALEEVLQGRRESITLELALRLEDGTEVVTSHRLHTLRGEDGEPIGAQGIGHDVSRERQADRARRLHQDLVEALDDYVFMADASGRLLAANRKARQDLGWAPGEITDMTIWDLLPGDQRTKVDRERWRILEEGASAFEISLLTKDGRRIPTLARMTYSPDSGTLQGVFRDISEEQLLRERLMEVERLRALGEMSSGVAHTFNNLLAVIGTTVQVARRLTQDPPLLAELEAIQQTVYDGGAAVRRIQDFARKRPPELEADFDLNDVLRETARVASQHDRIRCEAKGEVAIETELGDLPGVRGSYSELKDVFLNLAFNALAALPDGGRLTFRSAPRDAHVMAEVEDTGRGMTPEVRAKIFTPFFSTKGERGSGLGLAIARNVISKHGGNIEVVSELGRGTTVRVTLPVAPSADELSSPPARVLLAVNEPLLRLQLERELTGKGHSALGVASGKEALRQLEETPFDLVFTDLALTPPLALRVADRAKAKGSRVVLLAGWGAEVDDDTVREHQIDAVLRKPFPAVAVHNLLHGLLRS